MFNYVSTDALDDEVRATLVRALTDGTRVAVIVRGDPTTGRAARLIEGVPVAFRPTADGRERVALEVYAGESEQLVLLERIARVRPVAGE